MTYKDGYCTGDCNCPNTIATVCGRDGKDYQNVSTHRYVVVSAMQTHTALSYHGYEFVSAQQTRTAFVHRS